ncbi:hypothetical protein TIFTF001_034256 [Ficus carica]|uniref:Gag-pol polyprotein n=1 Tax=Ficus carica TaxID=3494 RepID=A0AA88E043_FICCA|nr:hypothetical protein TIFTF001_034256 [Ficus carica]
MYYNRETLASQQDAFNNMKQGSMTVLEAVKKFEQLARLCPKLIPNEMENVRRMMKLFLTDIAKQDKEVRAQIFKAKNEDRVMLKQMQPKQNQDFGLKGQTSNSDHNSKQFGSNKRKGNAYNQGQQKNYPQKKNNQVNGGNNFNYPMYLKCGKKHSGGRLEAPEPQARIYAYTKGDVEAGTSHVSSPRN